MPDIVAPIREYLLNLHKDQRPFQFDKTIEIDTERTENVPDSQPAQKYRRARCVIFAATAPELPRRPFADRTRRSSLR